MEALIGIAVVAIVVLLLLAEPLSVLLSRRHPRTPSNSGPAQDEPPRGDPDAGSGERS